MKLCIALFCTLPVFAQSNNPDSTLLATLVDTSLISPAGSSAQTLSASSILGVEDRRHQKPEGQNFYRWSVVAMMAGNAADTISSWHRPEANLVLADSRATFGLESVALKSGLIGASFLIQRWALHHNPRLYRSFAWMNVAIAGGLGATAAHNYSLH